MVSRTHPANVTVAAWPPTVTVGRLPEFDLMQGTSRLVLSHASLRTTPSSEVRAGEAPVSALRVARKLAIVTQSADHAGPVPALALSAKLSGTPRPVM